MPASRAAATSSAATRWPVSGTPMTATTWVARDERRDEVAVVDAAVLAADDEGDTVGAERVDGLDRGLRDRRQRVDGEHDRTVAGDDVEPVGERLERAQRLARRPRRVRSSSPSRWRTALIAPHRLTRLCAPRTWRSPALTTTSSREPDRVAVDGHVAGRAVGVDRHAVAGEGAGGRAGRRRRAGRRSGSDGRTGSSCRPCSARTSRASRGGRGTATSAPTVAGLVAMSAAW